MHDFLLFVENNPVATVTSLVVLGVIVYSFATVSTKGGKKGNGSSSSSSSESSSEESK